MTSGVSHRCQTSNRTPTSGSPMSSMSLQRRREVGEVGPLRPERGVQRLEAPRSGPGRPRRGSPAAASRPPSPSPRRGPRTVPSRARGTPARSAPCRARRRTSSGSRTAGSRSPSSSLPANGLFVDGHAERRLQAAVAEPREVVGGVLQRERRRRCRCPRRPPRGSVTRLSANESRGVVNCPTEKRTTPPPAGRTCARSRSGRPRRAPRAWPTASTPAPAGSARSARSRSPCPPARAPGRRSPPGARAAGR